MPKRAKSATFESNKTPIRSAKQAPLRTVKRELEGPDGTVVTVDVPVYPPFALKSDEEKEGEESAA